MILYYSYGGNTRSTAEMIREVTGGDMEEIRTVKPYTGSYNAVVEQGHREVNSGYMPEIEPIQSDLSQYDKIILGTPVWWYTFAPAVKTFLTENSLAGKKVWTFATNGGWLGHTLEDVKKICAGAEVKEGLNIQFNGKKMKTPAEQVRSWASKIAED